MHRHFLLTAALLAIFLHTCRKSTECNSAALVQVLPVSKNQLLFPVYTETEALAFQKCYTLEPGQLKDDRLQLNMIV